jgi:hypothetical protein
MAEPDDNPTEPTKKSEPAHFGFAEAGDSAGFNSAPFNSPRSYLDRSRLDQAGTDPDIITSDQREALVIGDQLSGKVIRYESVLSESFKTMQARVSALEVALARIPLPPARLGHNNPPQPLERLPLTPKRRRKLKAAMKVIKNQEVHLKERPTEALNAVRILRSIARNLGSYCRKQAGHFVTGAVVTAAGAAGELWGHDIHDGSLNAMQAISMRIIEVIHAVETWASILAQRL